MRSTSAPNLATIGAIALLLSLAVGCGPHEVQLKIKPDDAQVETELSFDSARSTVAVPKHIEGADIKLCRPPTHFCLQYTLSPESPAILELELPIDSSYELTASHPGLINETLLIPVDPAKLQEHWRALREELKSHQVPLSVDDEVAFFLRTDWIYSGKSDEPEQTRSRLVAGLEGNDPESLSFSLRIEAERIDAAGNLLRLAERGALEIVTVAEAFVLTAGESH